MLTLTLWQLLAVLAAGGLLALAGLMWVGGRLARRSDDSAGGCLGSALALAMASASVGLLILALRAAG